MPLIVIYVQEEGKQIGFNQLKAKMGYKTSTESSKKRERVCRYMHWYIHHLPSKCIIFYLQPKIFLYFLGIKPTIFIITKFNSSSKTNSNTCTRKYIINVDTSSIKLQATTLTKVYI